MMPNIARNDSRHLYSRRNDLPDDLRQPRRPNDLIAHWEWVLSRELREPHISKKHACFCWTCILDSPLFDLFRTHPCRSIHEAMCVLWYFHDVIQHKDYDIRFRVHHLDPRGDKRRVDKDEAERKRYQRAAQRLRQIQALAATVPDGCFPSEFTDTEIEELLARIPKGLFPAELSKEEKLVLIPGIHPWMLRVQGRPTFNKILNEAIRAADRRAMPALASAQRGRGKPKGIGGNENWYLAVLTNRVKACQGKSGYLKTTLAILDHFHPPQFKKKMPFSEETLRKTITAFSRDIKNRSEIAETDHWLVSPAMTALIPYPDFLV